VSDFKQQPWWRRNVTITPRASALLGVVIGSAVGALVALTGLDLVTLILWLLMALGGGVWGYIIFCFANDRDRNERFQSMTTRVASIFFAALVLAFPGFWWQMWLQDRLLFLCLLGGVCSASMFIVGTEWGLIHLIGYLRAVITGNPKATPTCSSNGVWDRDLDEGHFAVKRNG
jgi:hypothetical protein